jgi:Bifunctional DNA primase/polymerase, N-terminal/AAA domain/Primase C terminal 1 (PriCT-1)
MTSQTHMGTTHSPGAVLSEEVHSLARRGFCLFPCRPRTKSPAISGWPERATRDLAQLQSWAAEFHNCNWAIATGRESGFFALDVDAKPPRNGTPSPDGHTAITEWSAQHTQTPDWLRTASVRTAHGTQYLFLYPADREIPSSVSTLAPGIDLRGWHAYIMAPSSTHPDGPIYEWANDEAIMPAPAWLLDKISSGGGRSAASQDFTNENGPVEAKIKEGTRNATLTSFAGSMRRRGMAQAAIEAALLVVNRKQSEVPLPEAEVRTIARSVSRYTPRLEEVSSLHMPPSGHIANPEDIPDPRDLQRHPVRFLVEGLVPLNAVIVIASEYGLGKTWLGLILASKVKRGGMFIGRDVLRQDEVVYLDRENPLAVIQERLDVVYEEGEAAHKHWGMWCEDEPPLLNNSLLLTFARPGVVLFFDALIRFHNSDENSPTQMAQVMARLRRLQSQGATVIAFHHRDKKLEAGYRGTAEIPSGADVLFSLCKEEDNLVLRAIKNRVQVDQVVTFRADWDTARLVPSELKSVMERRAMLEDIKKLIRQNPGISQSAIHKRFNATLVQKASRWRVQRVLDQHEGSLWRAERGLSGTKTGYFNLFSTDKRPLLNDDPEISGQQVAGDPPAEPATDAPAGFEAKGSITSNEPAVAAEPDQQVLSPRPAEPLPPYKGAAQQLGLVGNPVNGRARDDRDGEGVLA